MFTGLAFRHTLHPRFFEERIVFCHNRNGFNAGCSCLVEGLCDEFCAQADAAVLGVDDYSADGADFLVEFLDVAFPDFCSSKAHGRRITVDDNSTQFAFTF